MVEKPLEILCVGLDDLVWWGGSVALVRFARDYGPHITGHSNAGSSSDHAVQQRVGTARRASTRTTSGRRSKSLGFSIHSREAGMLGTVPPPTSTSGRPKMQLGDKTGREASPFTLLHFLNFVPCILHTKNIKLKI